ncbi:MAG: DUF2062 domain-containing protein [bacterium]|nr:DUF2062 domain-containing protein [bacterium]
MLVPKTQKNIPRFKWLSKNWWLNLYRNCIHQDGSPKRFIISCCVGVYIAFCPFIGFHTLMVLIVAWLFSLNILVLFSVSCLINNPWTMVPVYATDYMVGDWLLHMLGVDGMSLNPGWLTFLNNYMTNYIGAGVSLWSFLIGGNALGLFFALFVYLVLSHLVPLYYFKKKLL